jgi:hypothetical protein
MELEPGKREINLSDLVGPTDLLTPSYRPLVVPILMYPHLGSHATDAY